jgi:flagellar protein FliS
MANPYAAYKKQSVQTMTPVELIIKLYDGLENELNKGIHFIENKNEPKAVENANNALKKALEITEGLQSALDLNIDLSQDLFRIYNFFCEQILKANLKKDSSAIRSLLPFVGELKDAFTQISKMTREQIAEQERIRATAAE